MARKLAFSLEFEGSDKLISNLTEVELGLSGISKQLRQTKKDIEILTKAEEDLTKSEKERVESLRAQGKTIQSLTNDYKGLKDQQIQLQTEGTRLRGELKQQAKDFDRIKQGIPDDSLIGLRRRYEQLRGEINKLSAEARQLPENLEKIAEANKVKKQIDEIGASVRDFRTNVGNYKESIAEVLATLGKGGAISGIIDPVANILGGGGLNSITSLLRVLGPAGAGVAAITGGLFGALGYVYEITREYEKQFDLLSSIAGLTGSELLQGTAELNAITKTFGSDFQETLLAANSLQREFGISFSDSLGLIEEGLIRNADANGEYLEGLREYSTQAREAGITAEQLNQVLIRQTEEGIFSDKGIDAVKEAGELIGRTEERALRGLERLGIDSKQVAEDLAGGYKTTGDVIAEAADAIKQLPEESVIAKKAIDEIFGTPGIDAGRRFIETLSELGDESLRVEGDLTPYQERLQNMKDATLAAEVENTRLAATFAGLGTSVETLTTKFKTLGTRFINDVVESFQVNRKIIEEDGFFGALRGGQERFQEEQKIFREENAAALASVREGQEKEAKSLREQAKLGLLSLQDLREQQKAIKDEIDKARVSGEDFSDLQSDLVQVNKQLATATRAFNVTVKETTASIKEALVEGSIEQLTKRVSDLQAQINKTTPNKAKELIDDLNAAKLDLSQAKQELEDFTQEFKELNIESLPLEDQVEIYTERIERQRQIELQFAKDRITNEEILAEELSKINLQKDVEGLIQELRLLDERSADYIKTINTIKDKKDEIEDIEINIKLIGAKETLDLAATTRERYLTETIQDEEVLAAEINAARTQNEINWINTQLELANLSKTQREQLEIDLIAQTNTLRNQLPQAGFERRVDAIDAGEQQQIASIIPEFDPNDVRGSLDAIRQFNEERNIIEQEAEILRLKNKQQALLESGEDTQAIQNQIDIAELELNAQKNAKLLEQEEARFDRQRELQEGYVAATEDLFKGVGDIISDSLDGSIESAEDAQKAFLKLMLETVERVILLQVASATGQAFAQPDSVATFGATGAARAAILTALIKAAFSVAKNAIFEQGGVPGLKAGGVFKGRSHSDGGIHFLTQSGLHEAEDGEAIINKKSTKKYLGLLSAINEAGGGVSFGKSNKGLLDQLSKFRDGGVVNGVGVVSNPAPQIVNPMLFQSSAKIDKDDIRSLVEEIVGEQTDRLRPLLDGISDRVIRGLDESNRSKERFELAQQESRL